MTDPNHYEAPRIADTPTPKNLGQSLAARLLEIRGRDYTLGRHYRWSAKGLSVLAILFGGLMAFEAWLGLDVAVTMLAGMLSGFLLRDFGLARAQRKLWKFQRELLDWDKVQRMAA